MQSKWGWYNILYSLANNILDIDKITKIPILETLTYLAYTQDHNNKQRNNYDNIQKCSWIFRNNSRKAF